MLFLKTFITTFIFGFILDMFWLALVAKDLYDRQIGFLLKKVDGALTPNWWAAGIVYLAIIGGIFYFALPEEGAGAGQAFLQGAIFGLVTYSIYDFTNYALVANWPFMITIIDVIWGTVLCGSITLAAYLLRSWFNS